MLNEFGHDETTWSEMKFTDQCECTCKLPIDVPGYLNTIASALLMQAKALGQFL